MLIAPSLAAWLAVLEPPFPAAARQFGFQRVQVRSPEAPEWIQPSATSRSGSGFTAYSRRVPAARTVAKPLSRSTRRWCDTAGWEMPNSAR